MNYSLLLCWCSFGVWKVGLVSNLPRWSECSMLKYCNFERQIYTIFVHRNKERHFSEYCIIAVPTDFIVWIFDLAFLSPLSSLRMTASLKSPQLYQYGRCFQVLSTAKPLFRWRMNWHAAHLFQTWKLFINDLVAHPAWPNGQCSGCEQGPKDERKAACSSSNAWKLWFGERCVEKSGDPLMAHMARDPELFNATHYSYCFSIRFYP